MQTDSSIESESEIYVSIPLENQPEELATARPGQRVTLSTVLHVKSISEDTITGCLEDIAVEDMGDVEPKEKPVDKGGGDDEDEEETEPAEKPSGKTSKGGVAIMVAIPKPASRSRY
jgi:hypothetical protein